MKIEEFNIVFSFEKSDDIYVSNVDASCLEHYIEVQTNAAGTMQDSITGIRLIPVTMED